MQVMKQCHKESGTVEPERDHVCRFSRFLADLGLNL